MRALVSLILFLFLCTDIHAQKNKEEQAIVDEGKKLYKSEMASWYGTDIFYEKFPDKQKDIGGYFSYSDQNIVKCIFFSNASKPKVMVTISFDSTYNIKAAKIENTQREFTPYENEIYLIRKEAMNVILSDTLFKLYKNTNFNLIPLIDGNSKKVFVLTGPQIENVVIFGNDYLLTFDKKNNLVTKKQLHRNIIPINYSDKGAEENERVETMHTHLPETGDFITSTDICTLMLYAKFAKWKSHIVVSENTISIWFCEKNSLAVIPKEAYNSIYKDQEKK